MLRIALTFYIAHFAEAAYVLTVYGDVYQNKEFFTKTFPWVINNVGGEVSVDYYLLGDGRYSVPQMCALNELRLNAFLQAEYLKCEANGEPSESCLCRSGIDVNRYKNCVLTKGSLASFASAKYSQLGMEVSPVVEIGPGNTVFGVDDSSYLKKICTIFGQNLPRGCVKPFACNNTSGVEDRSGVVTFDCDCENTNMWIPTSYPEEYTTTPRITTED